ncbi:SirB family protein [Salmonella enterica subsp. indica]|uniref:SirB family protein n=2 Tax=Salmonella enterica TaxID=28901 RepID=A0A701ZAR6_SALER|nr:invasion regulator SirB2 [Salmonella enterica]EBP3213751.1 SirB family protein [Salmonella enterica subsp. arizonae]ECI8273832.1 SirB family protein [Salmonella enterica subsp. enterica]EDR2773010.1 SirB family protein [Salmonella enterica subsp. enterica serovar Oslo]EEC4249280.1 SirB family protein [Salmonella enterica subsp. diarizonae]HCM1932976.1 SirB family protein [Salmonella enterica subsp. indica serovar 6,7:z41:1,7]
MTIAMLLTFHLICIALSVSLFVARYWWRYCGHALAAARWTRIAPPVIDTLLLLSGIGLIVKTHTLPFTESGSWLTEKLFGVIIYIVLGFIALDYRQARSQQARFIAFPLALVVLYIIIKLATTKIPLLG